MSEEKKEFGIENCLEVIAALELVGSNSVAALKDGLQVSDIQYGLNIAKDSEKIVAAAKDIDMVDDELKDLSQDELLQLGLVSYNMVKAIVKAAKK
jgi:hypothetical protein